MEGGEEFDETEAVLSWDDETLGGDDGLEDDDVEMVDAETLDGGGGVSQAPNAAEHNRGRVGSGAVPGGRCDGTGAPTAGCDPSSKSRGPRVNKKSKKRKKSRKVGASSSITDINRFVIDTCRHLKEKKPYLVWNAVGCLGVSVVRDLVKEVDTIQRCGGQKTADGSRFRLGGGILWNILKAREPKAYEEIMAKGREFEKQFRQPQFRKTESRNEGLKNTFDKAEEVLATSEPSANAQQLELADAKQQRKPVKERIRVPVSYNDLFEEEEGEIRE